MLFIFGAAVDLTGCAGLPPDLPELSLEEKIVAYERHFQRGALSLIEGRCYISWHGWEAAALMVPYLEGRNRRGVPPREALNIIRDVQVRGCDLGGTEAERVIERMLTKDDLPWDLRIAAEGALDAIRGGFHFQPGQLDGPD